MDHPDESIESATLDGALVASTLLTTFPEPIESHYRQSAYELHHRAVAIGWLVGACLYDAFLISDFIVAPGQFWDYVLGRVGVVTPLCLAVAAAIWKQPRAYPLLICLPPLTMSATLSVLLVLGSGSFRVHYLFGDILLMMCGSVLSRPRTEFAVVTVVLQCACYFAVLGLSDVVAADGKAVSLLFCVSGGVVAVLTGYLLERGDRRSFLLNLRARLLNRELEAMAMTDPLTGVANRRAVSSRVEALWRDGALRATGIAVMMADIDQFKRLNDRLGHAAGDVCILQVAGAISGSIRQGIDMVSRHGGEEFLVVLAGTDTALAAFIAERIRERVEALAIDNPEADRGIVTVSVGVAFARTGDAFDAVVRQADAALYAAKHGGRNRVVMVDSRNGPRPTGGPAVGSRQLAHGA